MRMNASIMGSLALSALSFSASPESPQDIVATAAETDSLQTLVRAVQAAGLDGVLASQGPFTVFAPSDAAFEKIAPETLRMLLQPGNRETLVSILQHHVVADRLDAANAVQLSTLTTLAGSELEVDFADGRVRVADANIVSNDIRCSNGYLHIVDTVLLPDGLELPSVFAPTPIDLIDTAIERGVPLFNDGNEAACVAVYEVAAIGLAQLAASDTMRNLLTNAILTARDQAPHQAAWTLRYALDEVRRNAKFDMSENTEPNETPTMSSVFEFDASQQVRSWRPLNDTVMGGRSNSEMSLASDGVARFAGETSLENNGGFASVRAEIEPGSMAGSTGLAMRIRGDGRTYRALVSTNRGTGRGSYDIEFETVPGEWRVVSLPFDDMRLNIRGRRPEAAPPEAGDVQSIGLLIGDKRSGAFQLDVDWIRTYR